MLTLLPQICESAVEVEAHTDRYVETARADGNLKEMHVFVGAFADGDVFVPVQLEVKEYLPGVSLNNKLYVTVTMKNEAGVTPRISDADVANENARSRPASIINLTDLIANGKDETGGLIKYIPDVMLTEEQIRIKQKALAADEVRLRDMRYEYAVEQGDVPKARSMLQEKAREVGYDASNDWRMGHRAPNRDSGVTIDNADAVYGGDGSILSPMAHRYYGEGRSYDVKAIMALNKAWRDPTGSITVYRAVPNGVEDSRLRNGDWVSPTREYAQQHGEMYFEDGFRIIEQKVPVRHLYTDGNSIHEFGYDNGRDTEVYINTRNNVKLAEVTYDDEGKLIPLSKRYDKSNPDICYSVDSIGEEDFAAVKAAMEAQGKTWNEMYLRDQLGDEGYEKYRAWEKEQTEQKKQQGKERAQERAAAVREARKSVTQSVTEQPQFSMSQDEFSDFVDESIAQIRGASSKPIDIAVESFKENGTISNKLATDILNNGNAVQQLVKEGGLPKLEGMTAAQKRQAVKDAVQRMAESKVQSEVVPNVNTNAVSQTLESYPAEKQKTIRSYLQSVDKKIKSFVERVKSGDLTFRREKISDVSERAAADISNLLGIDVSGYTNNINTSGIQHILRRHGENGQQDGSMSADDDIARIGWVLENYDTVELLKRDGKQVYSREFKNQNGNPVPQIRFVKKIDGTYYVVEAAYENQYKKLWVQGAYLQKNGDVTQVSAEGKTANRKTNAQSELASPSPSTIIPNDGQTVNTENGAVGAAEANFSGKQAYYDLLSDDNVKPGREGDVRDVEIPEKDAYGRRVSNTVTNAVGAEVTSDKMADRITELIGDGALGFDIKTDKSLIEEGLKYIKDHGFAASRDKVTRAAMGLKAKDSDIVLALILYNHYNSKGDLDNASEILVDLTTMANDTARKLRLFGLFRKMSPVTQYTVVKKSVDRYVENLNKSRSQKNQAKVEIPNELKKAFEEAASRDAAERTEESEKAKCDAEQAIYKAVAAQINGTLWEKFRAWRYMAMLGNAKTQLRNYLGNWLFRPLVNMKRVIGTAIEAMALEDEDRTKAILGGKKAKVLLEFAKADAKSMDTKKLLDYSARTGDIKSAIDQERAVFNTKWLEATREFVQKVPEAADMLFKKREYTFSLAAFLKARGVTESDISSGNVDSEMLEEARAYAAKEALKATFNDQNILSDTLSKLRPKGKNAWSRIAEIMGEGVMPFRRTPANIAVRAVEYSSVNLARGIWNVAVDVKNGKVSAAEAIDRIAAGLTGTGLWVLGWALSNGIFGIRLRGSISDEEEREGRMSYSFEIGGISYDISWLTPANLPLLVGANLSRSSITDINNILSAAGLMFEPMLELSCLSSLNDLVESAKYAGDNEALYYLAATAATSYFNQFIPTAFGQIEQAFEPTKNYTYTTAGTPVGKMVEKFIGNAFKKLPGDPYQAEKVDIWGQTEEMGNTAERIFNAFFNPGKSSKIQTSATDEELKRIEAMNFSGKKAFPTSPGKTVKETVEVGNEKICIDYTLSADEWEELAKRQGQLSRETVENLIASDCYNILSDQEKATAIDYVYDYAQAVARGEVVPDHPGVTTKWMKDWDGNIVDGIIRYVAAGTTSKYLGVSIESAAYVSDILDGLLTAPRETKPDGTKYTDVRLIQKLEAVVDAPKLTDKEQDSVLRDLLDESAEKKYDKALAFGIAAEDYVEAYRKYTDTTGKGAKDNIVKYFMQELELTKRKAEDLYKIYAGTDEK